MTGMEQTLRAYQAPACGLFVYLPFFLLSPLCSFFFVAFGFAKQLRVRQTIKAEGYLRSRHRMRSFRIDSWPTIPRKVLWEGALPHEGSACAMDSSFWMGR